MKTRIYLITCIVCALAAIIMGLQTQHLKSQLNHYQQVTIETKRYALEQEQLAIEHAAEADRQRTLAKETQRVTEQRVQVLETELTNCR